jgi:hypothetical protein
VNKGAVGTAGSERVRRREQFEKHGVVAFRNQIAARFDCATILGWFRCWRDLGYPMGALLGGIVAGLVGRVGGLRRGCAKAGFSGGSAAEARRTG